MSKADIQFEIDQLRKDKMIFAIESVAISFIGFLLIAGLGPVVYILPAISGYEVPILIAALAIPVAFWLYMMISNLMRWKQIKKLEKTL